MNLWGICCAKDAIYIVSLNDLLSTHALIYTHKHAVIEGELSESCQQRMAVSLADLNMVIRSQICYFERIPFVTSELNLVLQGVGVAVGQLLILEQLRIVKQLTSHEADAPLEAALI